MAVSRPCPIDTFDDLDRMSRDVEGDIDERAVEGDTDRLQTNVQWTDGRVEAATLNRRTSRKRRGRWQPEGSDAATCWFPGAKGTAGGRTSDSR